MYANSSPVRSTQTGIHEQLTALVEKHVRTEFQKPIMPYNRSAFELGIRAWQDAGQAPLILDAGCGVGLSTLNLAARYPDYFVIGVDQSAHRLGRNTTWEGEKPSNHICLRADLVDFWRLLHMHSIQLARHYLLYPNPWPKTWQIQRRWHGHPVFPTAVSLGGVFECRSNWRIYVEECSAALKLLGKSNCRYENFSPETPITPFERKYSDSGHTLWRCFF